MRRCLAAAMMACLACAPRVAGAKTVAVVVGNNHPPGGAAGEGLAILRYADDDAQRYAQLLSQVADETILLTVFDGQTRARARGASVDGPPTLAALRKTMRRFAENEDLTVYLVFSGHGALDETGAPFLSLLDGPLTRDVLFDELLTGLAADRVHLIIDACHAAGVVGIRGDRFAKEIDGTTQQLDPAEQERWAKQRVLDRYPHVGVLASSSVGESSHEWSVLEAGVFSHEVLSGLSGAADINGDGRIEYSEVQSFIASANRTVTDPRAKPSVVVHPPALEPHAALVELDAMQHAAFLEGDLSGLGHFHIELADGRRYVDAHVGGQVRLALPPGPAYLRSEHVEYALAPGPGDRVAFSSLRAATQQEAKRGSTDASYRRDLFAEPYTYDYYRGYVDSVGATPVAPLAQPSTEPAVPSPRLAAAPPRSDRSDRAPQQAGGASGAERRGGIALVTLAGISGGAAVATGIVAATLRSRFSAAENERDAEPFVDPHRRFASVAVATALTAGVAGLVGALLLRRAKAR